VFTAEYEINRLFSAGGRVGVYYGFDRPLTTETLGFFRLYAQSFGPGLLFLQAEVGMAFLRQLDTTYPTFAGGASVGYRIPLKKWYLEPSVRLGYPHLAGFNFTGGYSF
jgi:hypothetical protein